MAKPYYQSDRQRLYRFPNGHGASVVKKEGALSMAVIRIEGTESFWLNYHTPFGPPKDGLTEEDVQTHLVEIEAYPTYKPKT